MATRDFSKNTAPLDVTLETGEDEEIGLWSDLGNYAGILMTLVGKNPAGALTDCVFQVKNHTDAGWTTLDGVLVGTVDPALLQNGNTATMRFNTMGYKQARLLVSGDVGNVIGVQLDAVKIAGDSGKLPTGAATESTLNAIKIAVQAQVDLANSLWTDVSGAFYIRREASNQGTITVTFVNADGTGAEPDLGTLRPVASISAFQVLTAPYSAIASGTGYDAGDFILHGTVINSAANPPAPVASFWLNTGTCAVIDPPNSADLENATNALLQAILTLLATLATSEGQGDQLTELGLINGNAAAINGVLGATNDTAATDGSAPATISATLRGIITKFANLLTRFPASLGSTTKAGSLSVTLASDQTLPAGTNNIGKVSPVYLADGLPELGSSKSITTSGTSANVAIATSGVRAVRVCASADLFLTIGQGNTTAATTSGTTAHFLKAGDSLEFRINYTTTSTPYIAAIQSTAAGVLYISELA